MTDSSIPTLKADPARLTIEAAVNGQVAIVREPHGAFEFTEAAIGPARAGEVLVRIVATGLCHTDLLVRDGVMPAPLPIVLGHEGAGVVIGIGEGVDDFAIGDHVVLTYLSCGNCSKCRSGDNASCAHVKDLCFSGARIDGSHAVQLVDGTPLHDRFFGQSSFATHCVADRRNVVRVRPDAPLAILGPLGCGVMTGAGSVWNALDAHIGQSLAVHGAGAVGLSAIMAAKLTGLETIIAIDILESRLELAQALGATHVVNASRDDAISAIRDITGTGVDLALDTTGIPTVIAGAVTALGQGGRLALVAALHPELTLNLHDMLAGCKSIIGVIEGGGSAHEVVPRMVDAYMAGDFPFDRMIRTYRAADINDAVHDVLEGRAVKPVISFDPT